jgi:hypothetical protein
MAGQSVCLGVEPHLGLMASYGLVLWGALSDERTGLSFVYAAGPCWRHNSCASRTDTRKTQLPLLLHNVPCLLSCFLATRWSNTSQYFWAFPSAVMFLDFFRICYPFTSVNFRPLDSYADQLHKNFLQMLWSVISSFDTVVSNYSREAGVFT